jgi:hypothetical protein
MQKIIDKIKLIWESLPKEIRVAIYYAGAIALNDIVSFLLGTRPIDPIAILKVFVANILLVFIAEIKPRIDNLKNQ